MQGLSRKAKSHEFLTCAHEATRLWKSYLRLRFLSSVVAPSSLLALGFPPLPAAVSYRPSQFMLIPVPYCPIAVSIYASKPASDAHVVEIERRVRSGRAAEAEPVEFAEAGAGERQIGEGLGRGAGGADRELEGAGGVPAEGGFDLHLYPHLGWHMGQDVSAGCHVAVAIKPHGRADVLGIGGRIVAPLGEEPGAGAEPDIEALLDRAGGETRLVVEVGSHEG